MVEPFFFAVTSTPSIGPSGPVTCPASPAAACAAMGLNPEVTSATARLAAVDSMRCFIRMGLLLWCGVMCVACAGHSGVRALPREPGIQALEPEHLGQACPIS